MSDGLNWFSIEVLFLLKMASLIYIHHIPRVIRQLVDGVSGIGYIWHVAATWQNWILIGQSALIGYSTLIFDRSFWKLPSTSGIYFPAILSHADWFVLYMKPTQRATRYKLTWRITWLVHVTPAAMWACVKRWLVCATLYAFMCCHVAETPQISIGRSTWIGLLIGRSRGLSMIKCGDYYTIEEVRTSYGCTSYIVQV